MNCTAATCTYVLKHISPVTVTGSQVKGSGRGLLQVTSPSYNGYYWSGCDTNHLGAWTASTCSASDTCVLKNGPT